MFTFITPLPFHPHTSSSHKSRRGVHCSLPVPITSLQRRGSPSLLPSCRCRARPMEAVDKPPPHPPYTLLGLLLREQTDSLSPSRSPARGFAAGIDASLFLSIYVERGSIALQWVGLLLVTAFLFHRLSGFLRLWVAAKSIPGPPWGSFFWDRRVCSKGENVNDYLSRMHKTYGSIVKIWLSPTELLVSFVDPLAISDVLVKVNDKFPLYGRALRLIFGRSSLFSPLYDEVRTRKEPMEFNLNKNLVGKSRRISFDVLKWVLEKDHRVMFEKKLDCYSISQHFAFYFLGAMLFGSSFFLWQNATTYEELLINVAEDANFLASSKIPPIWRIRFWRSCWLSLKLKCLTLELIQQCRKNDNLSGQICQIHTGRSAMFHLDDSTTEELCFEGTYQCLISEEEPCGNIMGIMFHGFSRIAGLIYHLLSRLAIQPDLQEQIYTEIKDTYNRESGPNNYDVQNMQLLMALVYESIRLLPGGPLLQRFLTKQDINVRNEVTVPEGVLLIVPTQLVQKDHSVWGSNASQFSPRRFISESGTPQETKHGKKLLLMGEENKTAAFVPFGLGQRACVGQKIVIHSVSNLLASLLLHYQVKLQPELPSRLKRETIGASKGQTLPNQKIALLKRNSQGFFS